MTENEAIQRIEDYVSECGYTWTIGEIFREYIKLKNHFYISHTARDVIDNCITCFKVLERIYGCKLCNECAEYVVGT